MINYLLKNLTKEPKFLYELGDKVEILETLDQLEKQKIDINFDGERLSISDDYPLPQFVTRSEHFGGKFYYFTEIDSTQNFLKNLDDKEHGALAVAEHQTQGRGRRGNVWQDSKGSLLFSFLLLETSISLNILPFAVAASIVSALKDLNIQVFMKWPNDILSTNRKKLGGILIEHNVKHNITVVGIGLNVFSAPNDFAYLNTSSNIKRSNLLSLILKELDFWLYTNEDYILDFWRENNLTLGEEVLIRVNQKQIKATALTITNQGHLIIKTEDGVKEITAGDIELIKTY